MPKRSSPEKTREVGRVYMEQQRAKIWENILTAECDKMIDAVPGAGAVAVSPATLARQLAQNWHPPKRALSLPATRR